MEYLRSMSKAKRRLVFPLIALIVFAMIGVIPASAKKHSINNGPLPDNCVKFEESDIGTAGVSATASLDGVDVTVVVESWLTKDGEPDEYVGFTYSVDGGTATFSVKSGKDIHGDIDGAGDDAGDWVNPNGTGSNKAKGISNIVFCLTPATPDPDPDPDPAWFKIVKTVDETLGDGPYTFDIAGDGVAITETVATSGLMGMGDTHELSPGTYTATEQIPGNAIPASIVCEGTGFTYVVLTFPGSSIPYGVDVTLEEGGNAVCTFHNVLDTT